MPRSASAPHSRSPPGPLGSSPILGRETYGTSCGVQLTSRGADNRRYERIATPTGPGRPPVRLGRAASSFVLLAIAALGFTLSAMPAAAAPSTAPRHGVRGAQRDEHRPGQQPPGAPADAEHADPAGTRTEPLPARPGLLDARQPRRLPLLDPPRSAPASRASAAMGENLAMVSGCDRRPRRARGAALDGEPGPPRQPAQPALPLWSASGAASAATATSRSSPPTTAAEPPGRAAAPLRPGSSSRSRRRRRRSGC